MNEILSSKTQIKIYVSLFMFWLITTHLLYDLAYQTLVDHNLLLVAKIIIFLSIIILSPILYIKSALHEPLLYGAKIIEDKYFDEIKISGKSEAVRKIVKLIIETLFTSFFTYLILRYSYGELIEFMNKKNEYAQHKFSLLLPVILGVLLFIIYLVVKILELFGISKKIEK